MKPKYKTEYINSVAVGHTEMAVYNYNNLNEICYCSIVDRVGYVNGSLVGFWKVKKLK